MRCLCWNGTGKLGGNVQTWLTRFICSWFVAYFTPLSDCSRKNYSSSGGYQVYLKSLGDGKIMLNLQSVKFFTYLQGVGWSLFKILGGWGQGGKVYPKSSIGLKIIAYLSHIFRRFEAYPNSSGGNGATNVYHNCSGGPKLILILERLVQGKNLSHIFRGSEVYPNSSRGYG